MYNNFDIDQLRRHQEIHERPSRPECQPSEYKCAICQDTFDSRDKLMLVYFALAICIIEPLQLSRESAQTTG